jgi:hypothetical protein
MAILLNNYFLKLLILAFWQVCKTSNTKGAYSRGRLLNYA